MLHGNLMILIHAIVSNRMILIHSNGSKFFKNQHVVLSIDIV